MPLLSVLLGAGITYWLNVRDRRRTRVEELFARAVGAVAAAEASQNYMSGLARPPGMSEDDHARMASELAREAVAHHTSWVAAAREAVAEASAYRPSLAAYVNAPPQSFVRDTGPLIAELRARPMDR